MDKLDYLLQNRIKNEFNNINPSDDALSGIICNVKEAYERKTAIPDWKKYYKVAIIAIVALIIINGKSITAFVINAYQQYIAKLGTEYDKIVEDYINELDKDIVVGDDTITINQYVVTDNGIDFKVRMKDESDIKLVGCEIALEGKDVLDTEMFIKTSGFYIASNVFEEKTWAEYENEKVNGTVELMYTNIDDTSEIYSETIEVTIDISKKYQTTDIKFENKQIEQSGSYKINEIYLGPWYMKVMFKPTIELENPILTIYQKEEEILPLAARFNENGAEVFYQLPDTVEEPLEIVLGNISIEEGSSHIDTVGDTQKIELQEYIGD